MPATKVYSLGKAALPLVQADMIGLLLRSRHTAFGERWAAVPAANHVRCRRTALACIGRVACGAADFISLTIHQLMKKIHLFAILLTSLFLIGCGEQGPNTHHVEGVVTLNGEPLDGAMLSFHPVTGGENTRSAAGRTNESGGYTLTADTGLQGRGAFAGEYIVTVRKVEHTPVLGGDPRDTTQTLITPRAYSEPNSTPLRATVNPGRNEINFEVTGR